MSRCCVVGSVNIDLVTGVDFFPEPGQTIAGTSFEIFQGGKGANQAVALRRLSGSVELVAAVGDDRFGSDYLESLEREGVGIAGIEVLGGTRTGTASIEVSARTGQNRIVIVAGANGGLSPELVRRRRALIEGADFTLLQLEIPMESTVEAAEIAHRAGRRVILDPAPATALPRELLESVDVITPNESEAASLTGVDTSTEAGIEAALAALAALGIGTVVVKAGARGAYLFDHGASRKVPGFAVPTVDTVAAGDSFNGGLAFALGRGLPIREAVRFANAVGALSTTKPGAQSAMPALGQVESFMAARPPR